MDTQGGIMFYDICRLCLDKRGEQSMFDEDDLLEDIFACTGVRVKPTDQLPRTICEICFDTVTKAKKLRNLAKKNHKHLQVLFGEDIEDSDAEALVIDETNDRDQADNVETIQSILNGGRLVDSDCQSEVARNISVRKDLIASPTPNETPDSSSGITKASKNSPKRHKPMVKKRKVLVEDGNKDVSQKLKDDSDVQYECLTCRKEFETYKKLYHHKRLHNKSIPCPDCSKKFATKGDLQKHQRIHTGERPFACDICDKRFKQKVTLKHHKDAMHD